MTYDQARGYCFEKNMWLADPMSPFLLDGIRDAVEKENFPTVWFQPEWAKPGECWIEEEMTEVYAFPEFEERAVDCWGKYQAICNKGQIRPELKTCLDFQLAPIVTNSYDEAKAYCQSFEPRLSIGNLPFFFSQDELDLFNQRANLTVNLPFFSQDDLDLFILQANLTVDEFEALVNPEQLLGLVRAPEFVSGWGAYNGEQFIEVNVFAWAEGQPTSDEENDCVITRSANPRTWRNLPCDSWNGISFSCRIQWEQFAGTECIAQSLPDPFLDLL